jgi:hypothetical protein
VRAKSLSAWVIAALLLGAVPFAIMLVALGASIVNLSAQTGPSCYPASGTVTYAGLTSGQRAFGSELAANTRLDAAVISAWMFAEENGPAAQARQWANNNDWLNIGYTGPITFAAGDSIWTSPITAADATAGWLAGEATIAGYGTASAGIQAILTTAGQAPAVQIAAIQRSGWAASGYPDLPADYLTVTRSATTLRVSLPASPAAACPAPTQAGAAGSDPIRGFAIGRDDMGVDGSASVGTTIFAPAASQLVGVLQDWFGIQPLLLFQFATQPPGAPCDYWYLAEQITPVSETIGTQFAAGRPVATFAPAGTGIEIGWGSPTSNSRTLAGQDGDPGAANPPPGARTVWGESFKKAFGIRPLGVSP